MLLIVRNSQCEKKRVICFFLYAWVFSILRKERGLVAWKKGEDPILLHCPFASFFILPWLVGNCLLAKAKSFKILCSFVTLRLP